MLNARILGAIMLAGLLLLMSTVESFAQVASRVGPLEISLTRANLLLVHHNANTIISPTLRLKIYNTSVSDVKIILYKESIAVTDNRGGAIFRGGRINSSGILLSDKHPNKFNESFQDERGRFTTLAPMQTIEAQIFTNSPQKLRDKDGEIIRTYRPRTIDFTAQLGVVSIDNSTDIRTVSFSEVPILITAR